MIRKATHCFLFLILASLSAFAWPSCKGNWVQVPTGTTGGTIYKTGDGLTFQCQTPQPPTTSNNPINVSSTSGASSNSASNSSSSANAGATAKGGNATSVANGGNQQQGQQQSATATNAGNNSSYNSSTVVNAPDIPVNTAYAPTAIPTAPCTVGYGGGLQTAPVGLSIGGSKIDKNCEALETARFFGIAKSRLAMCKVAITTKAAKKAHVTLADCMAQEPQPQPVIVTPAPLVSTTAPAPVTVIVQPQPVAPPVTERPHPKEYDQEITVVPKKHVVKKKTSKPCPTLEK